MMKMEGGDASTYAASVYGGIGQQHPVSDTNHTIAMNKVDCGMKGGDASPLSTPTTMSPAPLNGGNPLRDDDDDDDEEPPLQGGDGDAVIPENSENNSNIAGGDSVLADLAVPAVLLVANQAMSKGRRKTSKKSRKNRRYRKKRSARRRR
jgi:hypothetical protein